MYFIYKAKSKKLGICLNKGSRIPSGKNAAGRESKPTDLGDESKIINILADRFGKSNRSEQGVSPPTVIQRELEAIQFTTQIVLHKITKYKFGKFASEISDEGNFWEIYFLFLFQLYTVIYKEYKEY
jgi:hypothetical protein